jgi:hypothetical protein
MHGYCFAFLSHHALNVAGGNSLSHAKRFAALRRGVMTITSGLHNTYSHSAAVGCGGIFITANAANEKQPCLPRREAGKQL